MVRQKNGFEDTKKNKKIDRQKKAAVKSFEDQLLALTHTQALVKERRGSGGWRYFWGFWFLSLTTFGNG